MTSIWRNCYDDGWQGKIVPEAFAHPAKFSRGLIYRIYQHAFDMGWVKAGNMCLDPFAGVALGAVDPLAMGLNWIGIELEDRFVKLGEQNIELWHRQLRNLPGLGTARIVQGDSRNLRAVIEGADIVISSPPYADVVKSGEGTGATTINKANQKASSQTSYGHTPGNLANMKEGEIELVISSPPFSSSEIVALPKDRIRDTSSPKKHGSAGPDYIIPRSPGQLSSMKEGDVDMVVGSPPFSDCERGGTGVMKHSSDCHCNYCLKNKGNAGNVQGGKWGLNTPGQLGSMPEGFDLIAASPPYEECLKASNSDGIDWSKCSNGKGGKRDFSIEPGQKVRKHMGIKYSESSNNLGNTTGDTFWAVSKTILEQCFELLKPGGHAVFVTKSYVKGGKIVDFPGRWLALSEAVGFKLVCRHMAMLVKEYGTQITLTGEEKLRTERKSFFRRLAEAKGSPRIDWEHVLCLVKE